MAFGEGIILTCGTALACGQFTHPSGTIYIIYIACGLLQVGGT